MKKILLIAATISIFNFQLSTSFAQQPEALMQQGNEAYQKSDFPKAIESYTAILDAGYENADLYYNLGNAYFRMEEYGQAILNYHRALHLRPNFREARQNLELAESRTNDQITPLPEFFLSRWLTALIQWLSPQGWRIAVLIILLITCATVVFFFLSHDYRWRKGTLIGAIVSLLLLVLTSVCAISSSHRFNRHDQAVVTLPMIVVKGSPDPDSVDKLVLHEGTVVTIDETIGDWHKIHIADGNTGWLPLNEITII